MRLRLSRGLLVVMAAVVVVYAVFPIYWLVITSVKEPAEVARWPPAFWPSRLDWSNFKAVLGTPLMVRALSNTLIISATSTTISLVVGTLAAYSLAASRFSKVIRMSFVGWILATRTFPPITTAIPYYVLISNLGLVDSRKGLVITYVSMTLPFVIWLMMGFFQELPEELEEAAIVDGCSVMQRLRYILLPLVAPGLAVAGILVMIAVWNEFLFASILTSVEAKTLPVVLAGYSSNQYLRWGEMAALSTLMMVPLLAVAAMAQRQLIRGLTFGAVKG